VKFWERVLKINWSILVLNVNILLLELEGCIIGNRALFFLLVRAVIPRTNSHSYCLVLQVCQIVRLNQLSRELDKEIRKLLVSFFRISWSCLYWSSVIVPWISKSIELYIEEFGGWFCELRIWIIVFGVASEKFREFKMLMVSLIRMFCGL
jgi:hypothetical protein